MVNLADPPLRAALDRLQSQSENAALEEIPGLISEAAAIAASEIPPAAMRAEVASALALVCDPRATGAALQEAAHAVVWREYPYRERGVRLAVEPLVRALAYVRGGFTPEGVMGWEASQDASDALRRARYALGSALRGIYLINA